MSKFERASLDVILGSLERPEIELGLIFVVDAEFSETVGEGLGLRSEEVVLIFTPLFQTNFFPLLMQVNFFPW
jgi:hypothetical protein